MQQNQTPVESDQWDDDEYRLPEVSDDKGALDRFAEAIVSPSEAFDGLQRSPYRTRIILWGLAIGTLAVLLATGLISANPELVDAVLDKQLESFERRYEAGDMTEEQRDMAIEMTESSMRGTGIMKFIPYLTAPLVSMIGWAIAGLILYAIARGMQKDKSDLSYSTALAAYLIALMIPHLEKVVYSLGMFLTGDIHFSLDANILVRSEESFVRFALSLLGPFTLWWFFVVGTAIAAISGGSRNMAIGIWALVYAVLGGIMVAIGSIFTGM